MDPLRKAQATTIDKELPRQRLQGGNDAEKRRRRPTTMVSVFTWKAR